MKKIFFFLTITLLFKCGPNQVTPTKVTPADKWITSLEKMRAKGKIFKITETRTTIKDSIQSIQVSYFNTEGMLIAEITHDINYNNVCVFTYDKKNRKITCASPIEDELHTDTIYYNQDSTEGFYGPKRRPYLKFRYDKMGREIFDSNLLGVNDSSVITYNNNLKTKERTYINDTLKLRIDYLYNDEGDLSESHWVQFIQPLEVIDKYFAYKKDRYGNWVTKYDMRKKGSDTTAVTQRTIIYYPF